MADIADSGEWNGVRKVAWSVCCVKEDGLEVEVLGIIGEE
jgi:hypothetical protein